MPNRSLLFAAIAASCLVLSAGPSLAQYYPEPDQEEDDGGGGYDPRAYPARPGFENRVRPDYEPDGGGYGERRSYRRYGSVCVTTRGNCGIGYRAPLNAGCRCNIPGFGPKRGIVLY